MALIKKIQALAAAGKTIYAILIRDADGYYLQAGGGFAAGADYPAFAEDGTAKGLYTLSASSAVWPDGSYVVVLYQQSGPSPVPAADIVVGGEQFRVVADAIIALDGSIAGNAAAIAAIPTAPLLASNYTQPPTVAAIRQEMDANSAKLANLDAAVSTRSTLTAGSAMTLTGAERIALASVVESHLLDEGDGQALLQAIVDKVNATDVNLAGLSVGAIAGATAAAILETPANKIVTDSLGQITSANAITAAQVRQEMDANSTKLACLDAAVSSRLDGADYTAPDNASIADAVQQLQAISLALETLALDADMQTLLSRITGAVPGLQAIIAGILDGPAADHNLTGSVGASINQEAAPIIIPLVTAAPTMIELTGQTRINLKRGDTYRVTFSLGRDCTGWEGWFGGKQNTGQEAYDIALRQVTFTDETTGTGYIDLSQNDTSLVGLIFAELELRQGDQRNTPQAYMFKITDDVVR